MMPIDALVAMLEARARKVEEKHDKTKTKCKYSFINYS
jgi:hypothetical protein